MKQVTILPPLAQDTVKSSGIGQDAVCKYLKHRLLPVLKEGRRFMNEASDQKHGNNHKRTASATGGD